MGRLTVASQERRRDASALRCFALAAPLHFEDASKPSQAIAPILSNISTPLVGALGLEPRTR